MRTFGLLTLGLLALSPLHAQYGSPDRLWWDAGQGSLFPWEMDFDDPTGRIGVLNTSGAVKTTGHAFFEALGPNGRACITCHQPSNAMSLSAAMAVKRWKETEGKDPLFAAVDGANCPDLPQEAASSHSLLLEKGLFRIALPWPPKKVTPEFSIEVVRDPTGCNTGRNYGLKAITPTVSIYRRPRVTANLKYLLPGPEGLTFMADGRETSLEDQAISASTGHEQAQIPTGEQLRQIVEFESQLYVAQSADWHAGLLTERDGPMVLGPVNLRDGVSGAISAAVSFSSWRGPVEDKSNTQMAFRASVARGRDVFFGRIFEPAGTTCGSCHSSGKTRWMDIGTTNHTEATADPALPLFRVTCNDSASPHPTLGRVIYTQDPGRALISGKCADVGAIVMQQFRGLSARAPYFSNGSAATIGDVVEFYDKQYGIKFTAREREDLVNYLSVL